MPLAYNLSKDLGKEPKLQLCCDLPTCNNCIQDGAYVHLACFHTFHMSCLPADYCCSICKEPCSIIKRSVPSACLPHYFDQAPNINSIACISYFNDKTLAFIPTQQGWTLFDSHFQWTSCTFLAMAPADAAWELLSWFKAVNSIPHNLSWHFQNL